MYNRILIANRGEIALRIIRACREMGIETVAVYSEADAGSAYLELADEAYCIGPPRAADSYLKIARVISAAEVGNVEAIHPGYGFLAENAHFNEICRSCQIDFVGPTPEAMQMLGDKNQARAIARDAEVPVVPGSDGLLEDDAEAVRIAHQIGFPVLVKATAGGGGRGMRIAANDLALNSALQQARTEAEAAFGNPGVYLEKFIERPRHVEVQIIADQHGNAVHLFERDCSTQRRHQKLIEESPAPNLPEETRAGICTSAVRLVHKANYTNAGTVEFIVDQDNNFYFIELNARIQVEHPVTEMVCGIDLVEAQLRLAGGEGLPWTQDALSVTGHAIECRVCCEDPARDFLPATGRARVLRVPHGPGVRFDGGISEGQAVTAAFDSMIGKLVCRGDDRGQAIDRAVAALGDLTLLGVDHNIDYLARVIDHPAFRAGALHTGFVTEHADTLGVPVLDADARAAVVIAAALGVDDFRRLAYDIPEPYASIGAWRN